MIAELHGVCGSEKDGIRPAWVRLYERGDRISIMVPTGIEPHLTPEQARYLAGRLYRMARRLERAHE